MLTRTLGAFFLLLFSVGCALNTLGSSRFDASDTIDIPVELDMDINDNDTSEMTCTNHEQCDDGDPCNGTEYCDASGLCRGGVPLVDGTECGTEPRQICLSERCQVSICGDGYTDEIKGEECDDANLLPGDGCENDCTLTGECENDEQCDDGHDCTIDRCDETLHICIHPLKSADTLCRSSAHQCDAEEYCDGINPDCPEDGLSPPGTSCNDGDHCTYPDECNGDGNCLGTDTNEIHDVVALSLGGLHSCALLDTGNLKCWGDNESGQLGDGTTTERHGPVDVSGLSLPVNSISCGYEHTCAILSDGTAKCWGKNEDGQLGDGSTENSATPVDIPGLPSSVSEISTGIKHTCALLATGGAMCWGLNGYGQLGDGTSASRLSPVNVSGLSGVSQISCGGYHSCALLTSGGVKCWGYNGCGELGDGTTASKTNTVDVSGLSSGVNAISAGYFHTCAFITTDGVKCWGYNINGQLGLGTFTDSSVPMDVVDLSSGVAAISCNGFHTCGILAAGGIKCWGRNDCGQLGDGTTTDREWPTDVSGISHILLNLATGGYHACGLLDTSGLKCWGANNKGQLGNGATSNSLIPTEVLCY